MRKYTACPRARQTSRTTALLVDEQSGRASAVAASGVKQPPRRMRWTLAAWTAPLRLKEASGLGDCNRDEPAAESPASALAPGAVRA
jgi:hypothetical protein